jgi:hypothetical protein
LEKKQDRYNSITRGETLSKTHSHPDTSTEKEAGTMFWSPWLAHIQIDKEFISHNVPQTNLYL